MDQAAPPGCRLSGIGRWNAVTNVRRMDQGASAGPDHGHDGPARWRQDVVTNIFLKKLLTWGPDLLLYNQAGAPGAGRQSPGMHAIYFENDYHLKNSYLR